ncbi:BTAD domain-containing putative transcriptional regulator [Streptomyces sp. NPDC054829]
MSRVGRARGAPARPPPPPTTVDEALNLWRGEVLDGVPGPAAAAARSRFQQLRLTLAATRAELDLELGEFERAATDLDALLRTHPHREDLRRLYLLALQRQGRTDKALEAFEEYEVSGGDNPELLAMGHELREALGVRGPDREPEDPPLLGGDEPDRLLVEGHSDDEAPETEQRDCARFEFTEGRPAKEAMAALRRMVGDLVAASGLAPGQYQLVQSDWGVTARMEPYVDGAPLLRATLNGLPEHLPALGGLRLGVTFWQAQLRDDREVSDDRPDFAVIRAALHVTPAQAIVALSDGWHYLEVVDGGAADPRDFHRLGESGGWYRLFERAGNFRLIAEGPAVRGPFRLPYNGEIPQPVDTDEVIVLALPDGELALPDSQSARVPAADRTDWRYFQVDTREHQLHQLGASKVSASWRVTDPIRAVEHRELNLPRVLEEVLADAPDNADGLAAALKQWRVPGYEVSWTLRRMFGRTVVIRSGSHSRTPQQLIGEATYVLLGFDHVLAHLYPGDEEREVLLDVAGLLVEERDPADALAGRPLPSIGPTDHADTLSLLRAFAGHRLAPELREVADLHEGRAARSARPNPDARELLRVLAARRAEPTVVTDRSAAAVLSYLRRSRLARPAQERVFGRPADLSRMMPHPHVLREALDHLHARASECVLIASTPAEQAAARAIDLPFIGYAPTVEIRRQLRAADDDVQFVSSLIPLIEAALSR